MALPGVFRCPSASGGRWGFGPRRSIPLIRSARRLPTAASTRRLATWRGWDEGRQLIPEAAIADIRKGGDPDKFAKPGYKGLDGWSSRDMWGVTHHRDGAFAARGVHGQTIYIDPAADMVIVRFASHPEAANAANDSTSLPAYQTVADYLKNQK